MDGVHRLALTAAALLLALPVNSLAASGRFVRAPSSPDRGSLDGLRPVFTPLGLGDAPTTVVVELAGDPVAVASANALVPLTRAQRSRKGAFFVAEQLGLHQGFG